MVEIRLITLNTANSNMRLTQGCYLLCVVAVVVAAVVVVAVVVAAAAAAANSAVQTGEVEGKQIKSIFYNKHRKHCGIHSGIFT